MARPPITVDESRIVELAAKGHTLKGIAAILDISYKTLHRRFGPACEKGHELRNDAIRAKQMERALAGSDTMLIWLGKQYLDQADKKEISANIRKQESLLLIKIDPAKIKALTGSYSQPQLPSEAESITVEPENQQNGAESMPDEARDPKTKKSD